MDRERKAGILLNYANEVIRILAVLWYTPLMLGLLGQQEYGLYQMALSMVSWLGLLNFGFGGAYVRFDARCPLETDRAQLNGMFLLIFTFMAALCLLAGAGMVGNARLFFGIALPEQELGKAKWLLGILVLSLSVDFLNGVFICNITARERFVFQNGMRILQNILSPLVSLCLLRIRQGAMGVALVSLGLNAGLLTGNILYCRKVLRMEFSFRNLPVSQLKTLGTFTFFLFLNQLMDQLNWSIDRILLGRMQGMEAVAVYGIGAKIHTLYVQLSTAISAVFIPKTHRLANREKADVSGLMIQVGRIQLRVLLLVLSGFLLFGRTFLELWAGHGYENAYPVALLLMIPVTVPLIQNLGIEILRARDQHRARSLVCAALAVGNCLLSIPFIQRWGCVGAAAGTAVTQILGTGLFMNWYYQKKAGLDMILFWKTMGRDCVLLLPVFLLGGGFVRHLPVKDWGSFLLAVCLYTAAYGGTVWFAVQKKRGRPLGLPLGEKLM